MRLSVATALSTCELLVAVVVFHEMLYGAVVTGEPRAAPSSVNWTLAMVTLEVAVADTVIDPETV